MFYKEFKSCLIMIYILETAIFLYVTAHPTHNDPGILNDDQLDVLANNVCYDLELVLLEKNITLDNCTNNFWGPTYSSMDEASGIHIVCQANTSIRFQIAPTENMQVVVLLPDRADPQITNDDIEHYLLDPNIEYDKIPTISGRKYTVWVTELENGRPVQWRGGEVLPLYDEPPHRNYDVKVKFFFTNVSTDFGFGLDLNGVVTWNTSGDGDVCFELLDSCADSDNNYFDQWPVQEPMVIIEKLPVNTTCKMVVTGVYGATEHFYLTPSCDDPISCIKDSLKLRKPKGLWLTATEEDGGTWSIRVNWSQPLIPAKSYNVTLWTPVERTISLTGDVWEAVFQHVPSVPDEDIYIVSLYSIIEDAAHYIYRGKFPPRSESTYGGVGVTVAWIIAAVVASALLVASCWRHARYGPVDNPYLPEQKLPEETDSMTLSVESEAKKDCWEIRLDKLLLHEVIGEGAFGVVRRGTLTPTGKDVAVKMLKDFPTVEEIRSFHSEMELMKSVGAHPHIVSLVGCCSSRKPLIVAEYCGRGDLLSYLRSCWDVLVSKRNAKYYNNNITSAQYQNDLFKCDIQNENSKLVINKMYELEELCEKELTSSDLLSFCRQIAMGMEYLALNKVVHRDLAARNILVTSDKTVKIADFGLSRDVYEENQYKQKGNGKLPVKWMALESLTRRVYTTQSDVWSFGVVLWEVVTVGGSPYASISASKIPRLLQTGYRMPRPNNCSKELYEVMLSCWHGCPRERPTFAQLHEQLDELLSGACAARYLSLRLEPEPARPEPQASRYLRMLVKGKRSWARVSYERPLKAPQTNHYTSPPVIIN